MLISRDYIVKTGTVIKKIINNEGFLETTVHYGKGTPLFKKGITKMVKTDFGDGEMIYDFWKVSKKGTKKGTKKYDGFSNKQPDFVEAVRKFLGF